MRSTMKALMKISREPGAVLKEVDTPKIGDQDVLVKVISSSICGTDLHIYNWDQWASKNVCTPTVFGHEFAGVVERVGKRVQHIRPGDHVSAEGHIVCGTCRACRTGAAHVCPQSKSIGITLPGCFAEYIVVPAHNVMINDPAMPFDIACLQDPLGNAVQTVLSGEIAGKSVAIVGVGPIGLMAVAVAKAAGAGCIYALDINDYRLNLAQEMGVDGCINSLKESMSETLRKYTDGEGVDVLLEMSGNPKAIRDGFNSVASAGRISLLGIPTQEVSMDVSSTIIFKGLQVHGITGRRMFSTWHQMKGMLKAGRLDVRPLITHRFRLEEFEQAFELMRSGRCGKVVFDHS